MAIALSAAIQAINGFYEYINNMTKDATDIGALIVVAVFVVLIFVLAFKAYRYLIKD